MRPSYRAYFSLFLLALAPILWGQEVKLESTQQQTILIELYTSQGCSSCPPAEEYLNSLKSHAQLWTTYIPLAFHVDYWDYLGWKDRFAKPQHRLRQEAYAKLNKQATIYTPGFFVNGTPWRRGVFKRDPQVDPVNTGILSVSLRDSLVKAEYMPVRAQPNSLVLNIAIVGMNLKTQIKAGENSGRSSGHEFVVLYQQSVLSKERKWQFKLVKTRFRETKQLALVAWVNTEHNPQPLQAVGGVIPLD